MNVLFVGFSTTGKSTLLKELKGILPDQFQDIDSDTWISKNYDEHIYSLFLKNYDAKDPVNRSSIMNCIRDGENDFIIHLKQNTGVYIAAIGPNVHTRVSWEDYLHTIKPHVIYLKAEVDTVYEGLKNRENNLHEDIKNSKGFGVWNLGVTRAYDPITQKYVNLPKDEAKNNIRALINVNEAKYEKMADDRFEATSLFSKHPAYKETEKVRLFELVKACINQKTRA
ncbi:hypothetical protein SAMN05518672_10612 [Chitinophaga sp. CF118]|uniref:hypothetical protein n=1 Tax=Chitinophaga sp. CF118 TaxID=1884367 RepID=UPI0008E5960E|nr:hypothetical protein [Chitinophaga sp. CF118]SFE40246.1 hypothetical protein SAMN05518672_10612 [Chitinophaga sp. CF118]